MKFYIEVYGCTANKSDANLLKGLISKHPGHKLISSVNKADVIIILTCTVIDTTEQRMLHRIKELKQTDKKIIIAGCMASVQKQLLQEKFPNTLLLPPRKIHLLFDKLNEQSTTEDLSKKSFIQKQHTPPIAPIAIAEGCLFNCSYCITHIARGKLYSYPQQAIISSVKNAVEQGCKEIQLTAQDTASYGLDKDTTLPVLLQKINSLQLSSNVMIRIGMMNPRTAKNILSDLKNIYSYDHFYSFLHLPFQSGDNNILKKMKRGYTVKDVTDIISTCRAAHPQLTIATDAIVGFPSETKEQFHKTITLLQQIKPDVVNITRFSARPFTNAKKMKERIPTEIVKQRSRVLTDICQKLTKQRNKSYLGETMQVITIKKSGQQSTMARSTNYKPVIIQQSIPLGKTKMVEIIKASSTHLVGMLK